MRSPIAFADILAARDRVRPYLDPSPLRSYALLDTEVGHGVSVVVKHENLMPTGAFKVRNGLNAILALDETARRRGVIAASTGNHGQGLAFAGQKTGTPVTICVPVGNNPDKNAAIKGFGARLVEEGVDYSAATATADRLCASEGLTLLHSTENPTVIAGAGTIALEMLDSDSLIDTLVVAIGGGSQAVGAMTAAAGLGRNLRVIGVQADGASAGRDSWLAKEPLVYDKAQTFADGIATRTTYRTTFHALLDGLDDFITVSDAEIADAMRLALRTTHTLIEPAGAVGLAGLRKVAPSLAGDRVAVYFSGGNVDEATLKRALNREV